MKKVRVNSQYFYDPCGWDVISPPMGTGDNLNPGDTVTVVNLPGCPRANTMGHCHILGNDNKFAGLVSVASLQPIAPLA